MCMHEVPIFDGTTAVMDCCGDPERHAALERQEHVDLRTAVEKLMYPTDEEEQR